MSTPARARAGAAASSPAPGSGCSPIPANALATMPRDVWYLCLSMNWYSVSVPALTSSFAMPTSLALFSTAAHTQRGAAIVYSAVDRTGAPRTRPARRHPRARVSRRGGLPLASDARVPRACCARPCSERGRRARPARRQRGANVRSCASAGRAAPLARRASRTRAARTGSRARGEGERERMGGGGGATREKTTGTTTATTPRAHSLTHFVLFY